MPRVRLSVSFAVVVVWTIGQGVGVAQTFPSKIIRIVTAEPGGINDFSSRVIAQALSPVIGQQVIIENRAAILAIETVAKSAPDGYTMLFSGRVLWFTPHLRDNAPWDAEKDFLPVILASSSPSTLVVHPSLPIRSVKDLIALAKSRPGELNYASAAPGSSPHLAAELFKSMAKVNIVHIPYKGNGPATNALLGGQVQLMFGSAGAVVPHIKSGRLKALAVTSAEPSALSPGVPTIAASGLPGYEATSLVGLFVPAKTAGPIVSRLNQELAKVLNMSEVKEKFLNAGQEVVGGSPEKFAAAIRTDVNKWIKLIKDLGIRAD